MTASLALFGEILPRLGCVNLVLAGDHLEQVEVAGDTITLGRRVFRVSGYQFEEKISGLSRTDQFLTFRLKLLNCDKLPGLLQPREQQIFRKFQFPPPRLELNVDYELECLCGSRVGGITPTRVLPLPSGSWKSNSLDWYCCVNKLSQPPQVSPRTEDILYNSYSFVVSQSNITASTVVIEDSQDSPDETISEGCGCHPKVADPEQVSVVRCKDCDTELGTLVEEFVYFWSSAVTFRRGDLAIFSNEDAKTSEESFKMIVNSFVEQSFMAMPKLLLKNSKNDVLLLWVMDKDLTIIHSVDQEVIEKNVLKILFKVVKEINVPELHNLETITTSNKIFKAGLSLLERSTDNLPESFKNANDYKVCYFDKK